MSRDPTKISRIVAMLALSVLVASATMPCAAWAKGGDQGNGSGSGGDHGPGSDHGNGGGGGQGPQGNQGGGGGGHGGGQSGGGAQANTGGGSAGGPGVQSSGASGASSPASAATGIDFGGQEAREAASSLRLRSAVVALNAAYAVPRLSSHAAVDARVLQMAIYDRVMLKALQMPTDTPEQRGARDRAIAGARIRLAAATNRRLNPAAVSRIDSLLGLPASDPALGVR